MRVLSLGHLCLGVLHVDIRRKGIAETAKNEKSVPGVLKRRLLSVAF
jgi:hypothetical protein